MQSKSWSKVAMAVAFQLASLSTVSTVSVAGEADTPESSSVSTIKIDLPSQPLAEAIQAVARQTNINILVDPRLVAGRQAPAINQQMSIDQVLSVLLHGTGLMPKFVDEKTITLVQRSASRPTASRSASSSSDVLRLAQADTSAPLSSAAADLLSSYEILEEILVTAQKRSERLEDVPVPVTVLSAETLVNNNQTRIQDYYTDVPGFSMSQSSVQGTQYLSLRGVSTGTGGPTVGILIDDIPNGSSTALGGGQGIPDLDPGDLTRIEVLRGPQGTLYGANSMGGLLNYVTTDPSTAAVSGRAQVGTNSIRNGDGVGYNGRGSVNLPLGESWAVRASGFYRSEAGYIDNDVRDREGVNTQTDEGGRLAALWQASDALSLKLAAMYQKSELDAANLIATAPGLGEFQQTFVLDNFASKTVRSYSAIVNARLGEETTLTSLSGYNVISFSGQGDVTAGFGGLFAAFFPGAAGVVQTNDYETEKFSQEVRLSTSLGERLDWLVGGYYTRESTEFFQNMYAMNIATEQRAGVIFLNEFPTTFKEYALFTDLTYQITERFDIQFGGRQSRSEQHARQRVDGPIYNPVLAGRPDPFQIFPDDTELDAFNYLITPRWKATQDLMVYARLASGYRAGGVNIATPAVPQDFDPDKTRNYELGLKGSFFERRLSIDASLYRIDWEDVQLFLVDPVSRGGYFSNGGKARSQGVELAFEAKPLTGLTVGGWVAWNEAELTEDLPPTSAVGGLDGDRLPFNVRASGKLSVRQSFPLMSGATGFVGAGTSYVGSRQSVFVARNATRSTMPAYVRTDVTAGVQLDSWSVNLYVNNVTDRRGVLMNGTATGLPGGVSVLYIQPRVIGVTVAKTF